MSKSDDLKFLPRKDVFTVPEVAHFFGRKNKTVYNWISQWKDLGESHKYAKNQYGVFIHRQTIIDMLKTTGSTII